jgi:hypothetical protein
MLTADTSTRMHEVWDVLWVGGAGGEKAAKPASAREDSEE